MTMAMPMTINQTMKKATITTTTKTTTTTRRREAWTKKPAPRTLVACPFKRMSSVLALAPLMRIRFLREGAAKATPAAAAGVLLLLLLLLLVVVVSLRAHPGGKTS
jgi:hypothetical protein